MKISVIIPSIRKELLQGVYDSIALSCGEIPWELVIASPYSLPDTLSGKTNIIYIEDHGTPIRGRQRALLVATGDYICYAADDCTFLPNSLSIAYKTLETEPYTTLVVGKYLEGSINNPFMAGDEYWKMVTHDFLRPTIPVDKGHYLLINTGLISRKLMLEIGGFDCSFEACAMSCCDISIRLQNFGAKCILQQEPIFHSTHLPGHEGDHTPIHDGQTQHDMPLFLTRYLNNFDRVKVDINNWQQAPAWWKRRFGNKNEQI